MPGFLLEDDAIAARQQEMDSWLDERKRQAEAAKQAAAQAIKPVVQQVQQVAQPAVQQVQQVAQTAESYLGTLNAEQQKRQAEFDAWMQQRQVTQPAPQPTSVAEPPARAVSLTHAEEPATSTDTIAAPDLGGKWKTNFDFGATYTGSYRTGTPHRGVDMVPVQGGIGTEVSAFHPGTVTAIQRDRGAGGLMVYVQDDQGLTHAYMHLAGTAPGLAVGQRVARGQPLAQMGESGTEGAPHLHYEVRKNAATGDPLDQLIDPRPYVTGAKARPSDAAQGLAGRSVTTPTTAGLSGGGELAGRIGQQGQDILSGAAQASSWLGEQGQKALQAILVTEGGLTGARGDNQASAGPLQFFGEEGGRVGQLNAFAKALGMTLEQARQYAIEHPLEAIRWAIGTATNPGYLGAAIIDGITRNLTGADLATHAQRLGQVSVSPERAGAVWNSLFGQGQPVQQAVSSARAGAEAALGGAVEASGVARRGAEDLAASSGRLLADIQRQGAEGTAQFDQFRADAARRAGEFSQGTQAMLGQARAGVESFDPMRGLEQANQMARDFNQTLPGQVARNVPGLGPALQNFETSTPERVQQWGRGLLAANTEAERQLNEPITLMGARLGSALAGRELAPEAEANIRQMSRGSPFLNLPDPGGVVSAGLKGGGMTDTVDLPVLGATSIADIIGLVSNFLVPTGAESRFGAAIPSAAKAARPSQQFGWAAATGTAITDARGAAARLASSSVEDIARVLASSPLRQFLRDESGELDVDALLRTAGAIKRAVTNAPGPEPMAVGEAPSMGGGTVGVSQSPTFLRESLRRMYPGAINKAAVKEGVQNFVDASREIPGSSATVSVDNASRTISMLDQGKGMTPQVMEDVFVKLGGSSKPVGASGGMGTAIKAIMANAEETWVRSIGRDPVTGAMTDSIMHGSGDDFLGGSMHRYYAPLGELPESELRGAPPEIMNVGGGPNGTGTLVWTKPMADVNWDPHTLNSWIGQFNKTNRIPGQSVEFVIDGKPIDPGTRLGWDGNPRAIPDSDKPSQFLKTIKVPGAEIDFYGSSGTAETGYADIMLLNNGQYQADMSMQLPGNAKMPTSLVADVRATIGPKEVGYPWTADRNALIDTAQKAVKEYVGEDLAADLIGQENARVSASIKNAPKIGPVKLVDDAQISETFAADRLAEIPKHAGYRRLASIINDLHDNLVAELEGREIPTPKGPGTIGQSHLIGLGVSNKWLGLNVPSSFTPWADAGDTAKGILIEPWQIWKEVERAWPGAGRLEQINRYTDGLVATMIHEIAHNTAIGGHAEGFAGLLTRVPQFLGSRMHQAITNELRKRVTTIWDTLADDLASDATHFGNAARESGIERYGIESGVAGTARGARPGVAAGAVPLPDQGGPGAGRPPGGADVPPGSALEGRPPQPGLGVPTPGPANLAAAAPGGVAGATSDEDLSPQERLYRGLGGAFVAGALRGKNPAVAAFEAQALRKGATANQIAAAVQSARQTAGKAYQFKGPIADAVNTVFNARPEPAQVLAARQFLRDFGGNLKQAAPPTAQNDAGLARLHNRLLELAKQGESQRFWYTNASQAIMEAAQGDKVKAEKLAQLFAIYSPGATVSANTQMALAAWHQFLEGVPIAVGKTDLDKKAQALLYDNQPWAGRKTNNFYRNLMKRIDEDVWKQWGREDGQTGTTVDIWMMRALQYLQDAPSMGKGGQYEFSQRAIERVAKELGWQPDEAQAAIWSSVKAAGEGTGLTEAGYHYGTGLAERSAQVGGTRLPEIFRDEAGQDVLAKAAGVFGQEGQIPLPAEKASRTLYDEAGNPIYNPKKLAKGVKEALSEVIPEAKGAISAQARQTIDAYAAARAFVQKLPQIEWARVFVEAKPTLRDSNSLAVRLGREATDEELQQVMTTLGPQATASATQDGMLIVNHAGKHERTAGDPLAGQWIGESNVDFHRRANMALSELESVEEAFTHPFRADTTTLTNDWSAQPNGEGFADVINRSQRAEALWDVARPLAARAGEAIGGAAESVSGAAGRAASELGTAAGERLGPAVSGAQDVAAELGRPRLADTGLAQGLRGALQPTDAEVLQAATPAARANAERMLSLTTPNPTEADIANALRASELGAGAAGGMQVGKAASRLAAREAGQVSARFAANLGGGVGGVATSEATMSEEDRANPWVRITRDLAFGGAGMAAPGVVSGMARQAAGRTPSLADLAQIRRTLGAQQLPLGPLPSQTMTPGQVISAVGKQNLLTGVPTQIANIASQLVELVRMPAAAAIRGGGDEAYIGLRAAVGSVPEALSQFRKTFSTGISTTATPGQQTQKWLPIFRFIGATDDFFRVMGGHMGSAMEAQRLVNEAGASTPAAIQSLLKANEGQIFKAGQKTGAASVFQAMGAQGAQDLQTPFGRWKESLLGALPSGAGAGPWAQAAGKQAFGLLVDALVPFSGMPARLFDIGIGRLPGIGETRHAIQLGRALAKGDRRAAQEALGDLGVQSIVSGVIVSNTLAGNVTGPDNKEHPNSVKINGTWVDYSRWGAFQLPLAIPAATVEAWKTTGNKPDAKELDYLSAVGNAWFKTARNAFFLDSAFDLVERIGGGSGVGAVGQTVTSYTDRLTPAFLNQVEQAMDANIRQVSREFPRSVVERAASRIPYLAQTLPAQVEMTTGGARIREKQGPLGVLIGAETGQQPKVERELYRLRDQKGYADLSVPREAPTTVSVGGTTIRLSEAEQHKLAAERGKLIDQMAGEFVRGAGYEKLTDAEKALTLKALMSRAEGRNAALWLAMTPSAEVERRMAAGRDVAGRRELVPAGR